MKKRKKWLKWRHRLMTVLLKIFFGPYIKIKYHFTYKKFKDTKRRPYLILYNHQTGFDQFFLGVSFSGPLYYVATEDIFSLGKISRILEYLIAPIPIKKSVNDFRAVTDCLRVAKEGGSIVIAPEGNRTFSGQTETIKPAIAKLAKALKLPIAFYRIEGGYGIKPRWADVIRKGKMRGFVSEVLEPETYEKMSNDELYLYIKDRLYLDETLIEGSYRHKKRAEYLERVIYICPNCGLSSFISHNHILKCQKCNLEVEYTENKQFLSKEKFPFKNVKEWYIYQENYIHQLDLQKYNYQNIFEDQITVSKVLLYKKKEIVFFDAKLIMTNQSVEIISKDQKRIFLFNDIIAMSVLGKNKINLYIGDDIYQFKGSVHFNAVKYVNIFYHYRNCLLERSEKFLGL